MIAQINELVVQIQLFVFAAVDFMIMVLVKHALVVMQYVKHVLLIQLVYLAKLHKTSIILTTHACV